MLPEQAEEWLNSEQRARTLQHDGPLPSGRRKRRATTRMLDEQVWGQV